MTAVASEDRLSGPTLLLATIAVSLASFMNVVDTTITIVALPTIAGNLSATPSQGSWVVTSYSICLAVVLPLSGWITRRFGEVRTFCISVLLFTFTSWLCAIATNFNELLLFRALQGCSGGLLLPLSQSLLLRIYPPERHGLALALWGMTTAVGPVLGPLLGGFITDSLGWPWIFLINIPTGLFSAFVCWRLVRRFESKRFREPVDYIGLVLLAVGVICFQLVLDRGHELDWLASMPIRVMLTVSILFFFLFLAWESGEAHPVVDLSLFRSRNFVVGSALVSVFFVCYLAGSVIYPIWLQTTLGYDATLAGLVMAPFGVAPLLLMPFLGERLRRWDARFTVTFGIVLFALAFYLQAMTSTDSTATYIALTRLMMGAAMPFVWMPLVVLALVGLPPEKMASATGLFNFIRMLATSLGIAVAVTLWDERTIYHRSRVVESLSADSPQYRYAMDVLTQRLADTQAALAAMEQAVSVQARTLALDDIFYLCTALILSLATVAWLLPPHGTGGENSR